MSRILMCGHTGATGSFLLDYLVTSDWVDNIVTIGRRNCDKHANNEKSKADCCRRYDQFK